jgi:outer membrane lipoprotein-sorting protein
MFLRIILILILSAKFAFPGDDEAEKIISKVKTNFERVKDYEVDVKIKVDVDFLKMPPSEAKLYFKQPDRVKIKSDKFAMIPREGLDFSPTSLLKNNYTALLEKKTKLDGKDVAVIKVIPLGESGEVVLTVIWVDLTKYIIRKVETSTKTAGTFHIDFEYNESKVNYPLPVSMTFSLNNSELANGMMKKGMGQAEKDDENKKQSAGKVYIYYNNYKINKGIPDSVFEDNKK